MKKSKGMTLIEVVIALAIFGMIAVAIFPSLLVLAKINILSKANLSSNYIAQDVSESLFHYSQSIQEDDLISSLVNNHSFVVDDNIDGTYHLSKNEGDFRISVTVIFNAPSNEFVTTIVNVASLNDTIANQNSQIESILSFGG
ncbi:MAG: type II secretion system protein [Erysipelotrichaceae bacterium]|nr:type II secretion system protein [Erysipelotrichaceae bacterium]MDD3924274.1 type II secretion system protein [Erysipelotrichaceae bacterium]MDD4642897.1 type II secretion system protein [Erysipelotrichaceae bacterium]